jgi:hypothetical protein
VWCGVVWCGVVWCGVVWCGVVWCGVVWCGGYEITRTIAHATPPNLLSSLMGTNSTMRLPRKPGWWFVALKAPNLMRK